jgi:hypothetical protein
VAPYRVMVAREILTQAKPSMSERRRLLALLDSLASDPFQAGDFQEDDGEGRPVQVRVIGRYALTFWADHAAKEVKVTKMIQADLE